MLENGKMQTCVTLKVFWQHCTGVGRGRMFIEWFFSNPCDQGCSLRTGSFVAPSGLGAGPNPLAATKEPACRVTIIQLLYRTDKCIKETSACQFQTIAVTFISTSNDSATFYIYCGLMSGINEWFREWREKGMSEWMNEWMNEWMDEWMHERISQLELFFF